MTEAAPIRAIAARVQRQLTRLYEVELEHSVGEFLVTDRDRVDAIERGQEGTRDIAEKLLVRQRGDEVDVALYLDPAVADRLGRADPTALLTPENLGDYWVLLEGVSHFVYLAWNAERDRPVRLLELELQAEVDKYVSTLFRLGSQGEVPETLEQLLFDEPRFDEQLDSAGLERYELANRAAARYCRRLSRRFLRERRVDDLIEDARRFWRLPQEEKLRLAG